MLKKGITAVFSAAMLFGSTACASVARMDKIPEPPQEYLDWLDDLKEEMIARGISAETVNQAFAKNYYHPEHDVVKKDRKQAEFVMTTTDYVNRLVNAKKADRGRGNIKSFTLNTNLWKNNTACLLIILCLFGVWKPTTDEPSAIITSLRR